MSKAKGMVQKMKALQKLKKSSKLKLVEVNKPVIKPNEILIKVWATGVCGSDILIEDDKHFNKPPVTLGHEFSGEAVEIGKDVKHFVKGDHIVGNIETETGWLGVSIDGSYAPYMSIPGYCAFKVPKTLNMDYAALVEPIVAIIHIMQERTCVNPSDVVTIVGPGPMGLIGVQCAQISGASTIILIGLKEDEQRLKIGKDMGADHILYSDENPEKAVMELTDGRGSDFVLECAGAKVGNNIVGVQHAIDCARRAHEGPGGKGTIAFISLWGDPITITADEISLGQMNICGCWSWNGPESWRRAIDMVVKGFFNFEPLITNRYSLEEWEIAFKNLRTKKDLKALIYPNFSD